MGLRHPVVASRLLGAHYGVATISRLLKIIGLFNAEYGLFFGALL